MVAGYPTGKTLCTITGSKSAFRAYSKVSILMPPSKRNKNARIDNANTRTAVSKNGRLSNAFVFKGFVLVVSDFVLKPWRNMGGLKGIYQQSFDEFNSGLIKFRIRIDNWFLIIEEFHRFSPAVSYS